MSFDTPDVPDATNSTSSMTRRRFPVAGAVIVVVAIIAVVAGVALRVVESRQLKTWTDAQAIPTVSVISPTRTPKGPELNLPGRLQAYSRASIFARVSGYLKEWKVDIGTPVKAGQLLAEIQTPELDQQLVQARADLATAQANAALAGTTARRWQAMLGSDSVSRQEVDERTGNFASRQAQVDAARANVDRLIATKGFQRLVAPFDGVVTARETDVGALINAGGGQELFAVSDVSRLRVYVQVPQTYAPQIRVGSTATLTVPEYPGQKFIASVAALSDAVNASSGTSLVQLLVDNPGGKLLPGGFTNVTFNLPAQPDAVRLPASALVFDAHGMRVATLGANDRVQYKTVTIARDFGDSVEIGSGLSASERIIDTPPDGLLDGDQVRVAATDKKANAHG